jgi:hypothetical protein
LVEKLKEQDIRWVVDTHYSPWEEPHMSEYVDYVNTIPVSEILVSEAFGWIVKAVKDNRNGVYGRYDRHMMFWFKDEDIAKAFHARWGGEIYPYVNKDKGTL